MNPLIKTKDRGEQAAAEVLARELENADFGAILVFEDSMVRKQNFLVRLPDEVAVTSTSEFLFGLQRLGKLDDAQAILDRAVDLRCNEILQRHLRFSGDEAVDENWPERIAPRV